MPFPPNLFLVGAQKAGTTYLANLLSQHPDICVSEPKEPAYFTRNQERGLNWYKERFSDLNARYLLDATTGYSASPLPATDADLENTRFWGVPKRIKDVSPDARIIYVVRDPVDRTYSGYWHSVRAGHETRGFREAIDGDSYYLRTSHYYDQLELYREHFLTERILIVMFEELTASPEATLSMCFSFLGVAPLDEPDVAQGRNRSFTYPPGLAFLNRQLAPLGGLNRIGKIIAPRIPIFLKEAIYRRLSQRMPPLDPYDQVYLEEYFRPVSEALSEQYDLDVRGWKGMGTRCPE